MPTAVLTNKTNKPSQPEKKNVKPAIKIIIAITSF